MKNLFNLLFLLFISACTTNTSENNADSLVEIINGKDIRALQNVITEENVNSFDTSGVNLLTRGVLTGDLDIVKLLIEKGADPNLRNKTTSGSTPLMNASGLNSTEIAGYLIAKGADVNIQDNNGDPAIHWSAYYGNLPFTKLMLDHNAKTGLKSIHADGVMQVALKEYHDSIVDLLLKYNVSIIQVDSNSIPLINAVKQNNIDLCNELINNENINTGDAVSNTLLIIAATKGYLPIVKLLIEKGADINAMNSVGQTALNRAVFFNNNEIAKYLISMGADINKTDERFILTPLMASIRGNNPELGTLLLEKGAEINRTDGINNFSPVMWAVLYDRKEFVPLLLKYDPDLTIVSKYKTTVFDMTSDKELLELLKQSEKEQKTIQ